MTDFNFAPSPGERHLVVAPVEFPRVNARHYPNMFSDLHYTIDTRVAELGEAHHPAIVQLRGLFLDLKRRVSAEAFAQLQRKWLLPGLLSPDQEKMLKFFDLVFWCEGKFRIARQLALDNAAPADIIDIGAGASHFGLVAQYLGHRVLATDLPPDRNQCDVLEMYCDFRTLFGVPFVPHKTTTTMPLPRLKSEFDLVTAFLTKFHVREDGSPWSVGEWRGFLSNLLPALRAGNGRVYLQLNERHITAEVWDFLQTLASWSNPRSRHVEIHSRRIKELCLDRLELEPGCP